MNSGIEVVYFQVSSLSKVIGQMDMVSSPSAHCKRNRGNVEMLITPAA